MKNIYFYYTTNLAFVKAFVPEKYKIVENMVLPTPFFIQYDEKHAFDCQFSECYAWGFSPAVVTASV